MYTMEKELDIDKYFEELKGKSWIELDEEDKKMFEYSNEQQQKSAWTNVPKHVRNGENP